MDISVQRLQFLDLTDATEHDHTLIEEVLFSSNYALEVPWCSKTSEAINVQEKKEWDNSSYRGDLESSHDSVGNNQKIQENIQDVANKNEECRRQGEPEENKPDEPQSSQSPQQEQMPHQRGIFSGHAPSSLPHQTQPMFQMYQMLPSLSNVYVSNVTANVSVHAPYVQPIPTHYGHPQVPPQQQQQSPQQIYTSGPIEGGEQANRSRRQRQKTDKKRDGPFVQPAEVGPPSIENHPPPQFPNIPPMPPYYLSSTAGAPVYMMPVYPSPMFSPYAHTPAPMVYPQTNNIEPEAEDYHGRGGVQTMHSEESGVVMGCPIRAENAADQRKDGAESSGKNYPMEIPHPSGCQPGPENEQFKQENSSNYSGESQGMVQVNSEFLETPNKEDMNGNYCDKKEMGLEKLDSSKLRILNEVAQVSSPSMVESADGRQEGVSKVPSPAKKLISNKLDVNNVNKVSVNMMSHNNPLAKDDIGGRPAPTSALQIDASQIKHILKTETKAVEMPKPLMPVSDACKDIAGVEQNEKTRQTTQPAGDNSEGGTSGQTTSSSGGGKSWASLFNRSEQLNRNMGASDVRGRPLARVQPYSETEACIASVSGSHSPSAVPSTEIQSESFPPIKTNGSLVGEPTNVIYDPYLYNLGVFLCKYELEHKIISLQPRGLTNRGNWCYINAILQALIACPPFYNLLKALPAGSPKKGNKQTLIVDALVEYANEFSPMPVNARIGKREKSARNKDENNSVDVAAGPAFEPSGIYKILNKVRGESSFNVEGRQEDAEEFLSCLLNGLNDEMFEIMKMVNGNRTNISNGNANGFYEGCTTDDDDSEWNVMGPKNKSSITRRAVCGKTPISDIFQGQFRSRVQRAGDQSTDTVQPFFTLQLDIEKANSLKDALELFMGKDALEGVTCSKTHQEVEAWTQTTLEDLPLVLILHLKCYDYKSDACSKIIKNFDYQVDLKIDAKLLANRNKYTGKQRNYKLVAVVYHDGKEASKGHYVTDAYHVGYGCWLRYDDVTVRSVPESHVLKPRAPRVPYLLYYRRADTISSIK